MNISASTIAITNLTGARNRGVEALVHSTIDGICNAMPERTIGWDIHTNDPLYDHWRYRQFNAKTHLSYLINTPNHTRFRRFNQLAYGLAFFAETLLPESAGVLKSQKSLRQSDLTICSGGDIFTSDYHNLRKHLSYPLVSKKSYLCSHTVGPFSHDDEKYFLSCLKNIDAISVREGISYEYLSSLNTGSTIVEEVSDVAFSLPYSEDVGRKILEDELDMWGENFVALSISQGIVHYSGVDETEYIKEFTSFCNELINAGYKLLLIPHVTERNPNNNDLIICRAVLNALSDAKKARIMSYEYSAAEFKSVIGFAKCLVGARTHATIASMSQMVPTVSIAYSQKAYGIVRDVYGEDHYKNVVIDSRAVTKKNLLSAFEYSTNQPINSSRIETLKKKSSINFDIAKSLINAD